MKGKRKTAPGGQIQELQGSDRPYQDYPSEKWEACRENVISIIVPIYNRERYLQTSINTIRRQTYSQLQIILVDDGSTDQSGRICDALAEEDDRILVIHKKNGGVSQARNYGLCYASGEYIGFFDSDDLAEPTMYEKLLKCLLDKRVACAMGERSIYRGGKEDKRICFSQGIQYGTGAQFCAGICKKTIGRPAPTAERYTSCLWDKLYKRDSWAKIKFDEDLEVAEDRWALFQLYSGLGQIGTVHEVLYHYVMHNEQISQSRDLECDYCVAVRMLEAARKSDMVLTPYMENYIVYSLRRAEKAVYEKNAEIFRETAEAFRKEYPGMKTCIRRSRRSFKILARLLYFSPAAFKAFVQLHRTARSQAVHSSD